MDLIEVLKNCSEFEWDNGNSEKNFIKHNVSKIECEQAFFNRPVIIIPDDKHSLAEKRFALLGQTNEHRKLAIVFTIRKKQLIRVISARDMSRKERQLYEEG